MFSCVCVFLFLLFQYFHKTRYSFPKDSSLYLLFLCTTVSIDTAILVLSILGLDFIRLATFLICKSGRYSPVRLKNYRDCLCVQWRLDASEEPQISLLIEEWVGYLQELISFCLNSKPLGDFRVGLQLKEAFEVCGVLWCQTFS